MRRRLKGFFLLLISVTAGATSFVERPFPETVQDAPVIVRGKVNSQFVDHAKGDDGNTRIYTFYELRVSEVIKGEAGGPSLMMRELGGEIGGVGMQVSGAAHFSRGDDVVVMLSNRSSDGNYDVWGMMMGRYDVRKSSAGEEYLEGPGISGDRHDHDSGQGKSDPPTAAQTGSLWTLARLRQTVASQGGAPIAPKSPVNSAQTSPTPISSVSAPVNPSAAPALQNHLEEDTSEPKNGTEAKAPAGYGLPLIGTALFAAVLLFGFFRRKRG